MPIYSIWGARRHLRSSRRNNAIDEVQTTHQNDLTCAESLQRRVRREKTQLRIVPFAEQFCMVCYWREA